MTDAAQELLARLAPLLEDLRTAALVDEVEGTRPHAQVRRLAEAGFGVLRLPKEEGGGGVDLVTFFTVLVQVAAADSNQAQIWRNHIAFVEDRLQPQPRERNQHWRAVLAGGAVIGGAWTEPGPASFAAARTRLEPAPDGHGWRLTGTKYYSTGSLYADWISVTARRPTSPSGGSQERAREEGDEADRRTADEEDVIALVKARGDGVALSDDWDGIGQKSTGSGTTTLTDAPVSEVGVYPFDQRAPYQEALYQLVLLAALAGIARAAQRDVVAALQGRRRAYPQGLGEVPKDDPQLQAVVGRVSALAAAAEASVLRAAHHLDRAADACRSADASDGAERLVERAAVAVYEAQLTVTDDVLAATSLLYDALGSSAVESETLLDRHWRNARTVTSHNPRVYKERIVGGWYLNATPPTVYRGT